MEKEKNQKQTQTTELNFGVLDGHKPMLTAASRIAISKQLQCQVLFLCVSIVSFP
ncbi:hypothetical protein RchiOBHm_Chr5g0047451 [Rosa chinensis]|uniref:Uncharacterized protein n=1 Tax=Rosa chinensis TaxID=74649 RepID=A0A2P6QEE4_ROSCH|nr:hypothetical protein RchiOBHm_Chr5g0047451 [Rosa chinensis]